MAITAKPVAFEYAASPKPKLGHLLVGSGKLSAAGLQVALAVQIATRSRSKLGEILLAQGSVSADALTQALARQYGIGRIDLNLAPPDPDLVAAIEPVTCLKTGFVPWRKIGGHTIVAIADPAAADKVRAQYDAGETEIVLALASEKQIRSHILLHHENRLAIRATYLCPARHSCRDLQSRSALAKLSVLGLAAIALVASYPLQAATALILLITLANFATAMLRLLAIGALAFVRPDAQNGAKNVTVLEQHSLPRISILVPLYKEARILDQLLVSLDQLHYPRALLDVKLILEANDDETALYLLSVPIPPWIEIVAVPSGQVRTKPRAMNFALPLCKGEIIGIYDAEDRPQADQLYKVARALTNAPRNLACVQGALDFYNTKQNWLTRCFAVEYAQWFRVLLPGLHHLGAPIPLGGTTVFFRRAVLEKIGGWDAHNVTEDADLGMRLARQGYYCGILDSTTFEEATSSSRSWVRQRSRWLKGYAITWVSHMRRPFQLIDDLGLLGFLTFQAMFLGTMVGYFAFPLHVILWADLAGATFPFINLLPKSIWLVFTISNLVGVTAVIMLALRALGPKSHRGLLPVALTMPIYWPLGAVAWWRAMIESIFKPFYWAKTEHGHCRRPAGKPKK